MTPIGNRRAFLKNTILSFVTATFRSRLLRALETDFVFEPERDLIPAPQNPERWVTYRTELIQNRQQNRERLNYKDD